MWEIVEKEQPASPAKNIINQAFVYGQKFDFMDTRSGPKPLGPGNYCAGGTVYLFKDGVPVGGKLFHNCFEIAPSR